MRTLSQLGCRGGQILCEITMRMGSFGKDEMLVWVSVSALFAIIISKLQSTE